MRRLAGHAGLGVAVTIAVGACSQVTEVSPAEVAQAVSRDGIPFDPASIPPIMLDRFAVRRVVLVGEQHFLAEHRQFVFELLRQLHSSGFRQLLFEWTQAADWLVGDFVGDGGLEPEWSPPLDVGGDLLTAIRDFNRTVEAGDGIEVHPIDANLEDYGGQQSFLNSVRALVEHLTEPGPLVDLLHASSTQPSGHADRVATLIGALTAQSPTLIAAWGESWYDVVLEMAEVEKVSIMIRGLRQDHYDLSVEVREDLLKSIADGKIRDQIGGTVLNFGLTHAQKERLMGTDIEWLGDYLANRSAVVAGSALVVGVVPAHVDGSSAASADPLGASPDNELLRSMHEAWPDATVFLPLDDPLFMTGGVPLNLDGEVRLSSPKRHYDAFVVLPLAHRVAGS